MDAELASVFCLTPASDKENMCEGIDISNCHTMATQWPLNCHSIATQLPLRKMGENYTLPKEHEVFFLFLYKIFNFPHFYQWQLCGN